METRKATSQEIFEHFRNHKNIRFRHFVREIYNPRSKTGVSHREFSRSKLYNIDGAPHVKHHGKFEPITATHYTLPSGHTLIALVKIDNPYLP